MSNENPTTIADDVVVAIHYTLTSSEGEQIDSSRGGEPLRYLHGAQNIVPGLEEELAGKAAGESLKVAVPPEKGYGERHEEAKQEVPRDQMPEDVELEPGMPLMANTPDGQQMPIWIAEVSDEKVVVDFNHPLAGHTLNFDVEIVELRASTEEEREHGHPHGPGGHDH